MDLPHPVCVREPVHFPNGSAPIVRYRDDPQTYQRRLRDLPPGTVGEDILSVVDRFETAGKHATIAQVANTLGRDLDYVAAVVDVLDVGGYLVHGEPAQWLVAARAKRAENHQ